MRELKFEVRTQDGLLVGWERLNENGQWEKSYIGRGYNWLLGVIFYETPEQQPLIRRQSTGLADKNGREAWQGDIVMTPVGRLSVIEWGHGRFGLNHDHGTEKKTMLGDWDSLDNLRSLNDGYLEGAPGGFEGCEIVGNIYDNPEYLKQPKQ